MFGADLLERLRAVRVAAFDIDGTLAGADHRVNQRTLAAFARLPRVGIEPVIITGRFGPSARKIGDASGVNPHLVVSNGSLVYPDSSTVALRNELMDAAEARQYFQAAPAFGLDPILFGLEKMFVLPGAPSKKFLETVNGADTVVEVELQNMPWGEASKVMLYAPPEHLDSVDGDIRAAMPHMQRTMDELFECGPRGSDKWVALRELLAHRGVEPGQCLGIGDGENDVVWLRRVGVPVAVANAQPQVLAGASLVIGHHAEDGVAVFLEQLLEVRGG